MFIIKSPNKNYNGVTAQIEFKNGESKIEKMNKEDIKWFEDKGYILSKENKK